MACMPESEANSKGYTNAWIKATESRLIVKDSLLYLLDEQGQCIDKMEKPVEVKEPIRLELSEMTNVVLKILCVFLFLCFFVCHSQKGLDSFGSDYGGNIYLLNKYTGAAHRAALILCYNSSITNRKRDHL